MGQGEGATGKGEEPLGRELPPQEGVCALALLCGSYLEVEHLAWDHLGANCVHCDEDAELPTGDLRVNTAALGSSAVACVLTKGRRGL